MDKYINLLNEETKSHSIRVSQLGENFGIYLGLEKKDIQNLKQGGLLHDIGKLMIPSSILEKQGKLTDKEYNYMKNHALFAKSVLADDIHSLNNEIKGIIFYHHERIDGKGYPYGFKGGDVGYLPKIIGICDSYDAIVSKRAYKDKKDIQWAISEIYKNLGSQFDKDLGLSFINFINTSNINLQF